MLSRPRTIALITAAACLVAAAVVVLALRGGGGGKGTRSVAPKPAHVTLRPIRAIDPGGSDQAPLALPPSGRWFGFNDETFAFTGRQQGALDQGVSAAREWTDAAGAGANSARIVVSWYDVEPQPGVFNDAFIALLKAYTDRVEAAGGRVLLVLGVPPMWASAKPNDATAAIIPSKSVIAEFGRFAAHVARAWPRAAAIETWNEPNTTFFWHPRQPEPELYVLMHRAAAAAIRAVSPHTPVLFGGLLGTVVDTPDVMRPQRFLKRAYAAGLSPSDYDGLAFHPYPQPSGGILPPFDGGDLGRMFDDFRAGYERRDPDAAVWITETGLTTTGSWGVTPQVQASGLVRLVRRLLSMRAVRGVYVHTLYDAVSFPADNIQRGFGLLQAQGAAPGRAKPAYCALASFAGRAGALSGCVGGVRPVASPTR